MNVNAPSLAKDNPLWGFVVWAYAASGVEKACLALQNRNGADVNMVLLCCWLAYRGTGTGSFARHLGAALKTSREWQHNLVEPLRKCRENLKSIVESSMLVGNER